VCCGGVAAFELGGGRVVSLEQRNESGLVARTRVIREVLPEPRGPMRRKVGRWVFVAER